MRKYYITESEIEQAEKMLREKGIGWINGKYHAPTSKKDTDLMYELDVMGMIHSFIAYRPLDTKNKWVTDRYFERYLENLSVKKLQILIDKAVERVKHVGYGGTDGEGCHYNGIQWK